MIAGKQQITNAMSSSEWSIGADDALIATNGSDKRGPGQRPTFTDDAVFSILPRLVAIELLVRLPLKEIEALCEVNRFFAAYVCTVAPSLAEVRINGQWVRTINKDGVIRARTRTRLPFLYEVWQRKLALEFGIALNPDECSAVTTLERRLVSASLRRYLDNPVKSKWHPLVPVGSNASRSFRFMFLYKLLAKPHELERKLPGRFEGLEWGVHNGMLRKRWPYHRFIESSDHDRSSEIIKAIKSMDVKNVKIVTPFTELVMGTQRIDEGNSIIFPTHNDMSSTMSVVDGNLYVLFNEAVVTHDIYIHSLDRHLLHFDAVRDVWHAPIEQVHYQLFADGRTTERALEKWQRLFVVTDRLLIGATDGLSPDSDETVPTKIVVRLDDRVVLEHETRPVERQHLRFMGTITGVSRNELTCALQDAPNSILVARWNFETNRLGIVRHEFDDATPFYALHVGESGQHAVIHSNEFEEKGFSSVVIQDVGTMSARATGVKSSHGMVTVGVNAVNSIDNALSKTDVQMKTRSLF